MMRSGDTARVMRPVLWCMVDIFLLSRTLHEGHKEIKKIKNELY